MGKLALGARKILPDLNLIFLVIGTWENVRVIINTVRFDKVPTTGT